MQSLAAFTGVALCSSSYLTTRSSNHGAPACITWNSVKGLLHSKSILRKPDSLITCKTSLKEGVVTEEPVASVIEEVVAAVVDEGPKTQVKFVLQKECQFGERFRVVGSIPLFGEWNVEAAIPMEWAEGNIWTVEVGVPVGQKIEFKYVLTGPEGEVVWQPGYNRIFETIECTSPVVINEPWETLEVQPDAELIDSDTDGLLVPADINVTAAKKEEIQELFKTDAIETNGSAVPEAAKEKVEVSLTGIVEAAKEKVEFSHTSMIEPANKNVEVPDTGIIQAEKDKVEALKDKVDALKDKMEAVQEEIIGKAQPVMESVTDEVVGTATAKSMETV